MVDTADIDDFLFHLRRKWAVNAKASTCAGGPGGWARVLSSSRSVEPNIPHAPVHLATLVVAGPRSPRLGAPKPGRCRRRCTSPRPLGSNLSGGISVVHPQGASTSVHDVCMCSADGPVRQTADWRPPSPAAGSGWSRRAGCTMACSQSTEMEPRASSDTPCAPERSLPVSRRLSAPAPGSSRAIVTPPSGRNPVLASIGCDGGTGPKVAFSRPGLQLS
jgi:hypothetical protein